MYFRAQRTSNQFWAEIPKGRGVRRGAKFVISDGVKKIENLVMNRKEEKE